MSGSQQADTEATDPRVRAATIIRRLIDAGRLDSDTPTSYLSRVVGGVAINDPAVVADAVRVLEEAGTLIVVSRDHSDAPSMVRAAT